MAPPADRLRLARAERHAGRRRRLRRPSQDRKLAWLALTYIWRRHSHAWCSDTDPLVSCCIRCACQRKEFYETYGGSTYQIVHDDHGPVWVELPSKKVVAIFMNCKTGVQFHVGVNATSSQVLGRRLGAACRRAGEWFQTRAASAAP